MKKILKYLIVFVLFFVVSNSYSFAHDGLDGSGSAEIAEHEHKSTYILIYPGMLPDNPLYIFKAIRDGFVGFIVSDPLRKAEFDLLQADKHISSSVLLVSQSKNQELALETAAKGQKYYEDAIVKAKEVKGEKMELKAYLERLISAGQKHAEVLEELSEQTGNKEFFKLSLVSHELSEKAEPLLEGN